MKVLMTQCYCPCYIYPWSLLLQLSITWSFKICNLSALVCFNLNTIYFFLFWAILGEAQKILLALQSKTIPGSAQATLLDARYRIHWQNGGKNFHNYANCPALLISFFIFPLNKMQVNNII